MTGYKSTNAVIAMILDKQFRISAATNKQFSAGEMVNFVQVDAMKLVFMSSYLPTVTQLPFLLIFCMIILFYYLGWSFMSGMVIFAITFYINLVLGRKSANL